MKRKESESEAECSSSKKRRVEYGTFQKWRRDLDSEHQTLTWLDCLSVKEHGKVVVTHLNCKTCTEFVEKIKGRKNFSHRWIVGAESVRISNVRDHAKMEQHLHAMGLFKKKQAESSGLSTSDYAPIAKAFNKLPDDEREKLKLKFDIANFVAAENLPFVMYPKICQLESHHGVKIGTSYVNENAGKEMIHFTAESKRQELQKKLANAKFFSLLLDGSTDTGNIDNEIILVVWCDKDTSDEKIHTRMAYVSVV